MGASHWNAPQRGAICPGTKDCLCNSSRPKPKQPPQLPIVVNSYVQIDARRQKTGMTCSSADLRKRAAAGQGVADERVPAVVDRQGLQPGRTQNPADGQ